MNEEAPQLSTRLALNVEEAAAAIGVSVRHLGDTLPATHFYLGSRLAFHVKQRREWDCIITHM